MAVDDAAVRQRLAALEFAPGSDCPAVHEEALKVLESDEVSDKVRAAAMNTACRFAG